MQIITAAQNVFVGAQVPVALNNSKLADGTIIKNSKLRGLPSQGMFCGGDELGVNNANYPNAEVDGILILDQNETIGDDLINVLGLDDYVLDFAVTFNRPDCNSIYGLAREVSVALNKPLKPLQIDFEENSQSETNSLVSVEVLATNLCPAYYMQGATDIKIQKSPLWLSRRLSACGVNSINNLVDITNYVLLEVGQPMHAFDYQDITDKTIVVRKANKGEKIIPLNQKEYELNENVLVIADKNRPVGLAGVMGGANSGIKDTTTCVMFESAKFIRENIRRTSRQLAIRTDSSSRFEKGVDSFTARVALARALHLVNQLDCGKVTRNRIEVVTEKEEDKTLSFSFDRIKNLLGISIPQETVKNILESLEIKTTIKDNVITCTPPQYRDDLQRDCDYIEEIIRVYGYDNITSTLLADTQITVSKKSEKQRLIDTALQTFTGLGYHQCITYTFGGKLLYEKMLVDKSQQIADCVAILNPLGEEFTYLRQSILPHLLSVVASNESHKNDKANLFEISKVFFKNDDATKQPIEINKLCITTSTGDFYDIKADIVSFLGLFGINAKFVRSKETFLHSGISADVIVNDVAIGYIGELHPVVKKNFDLNQKIYVAEINLDAVLELKANTIKYAPIPRLPSVDRDLALVVKVEVAVQDLIDTIKATSKMCESVSLFDVYQGEQVAKGYKSVALSLRFRVPNRTLNDKDIEPQIKKILKTLEENFAAVLR